MLSLSYDGDLSRVRATGTVPGTQDTFTRVTANGWGTSTSGTAWSVIGTAAEYSTTGTVGRHSVATVNAYRISVLDVTVADIDVTMHFRTPANPLGASQIFELAARWAGTNDFMAARIELQTTLVVNARLRKVVAGVSTFLGSTATAPFTYVANTWYAVRFRAVGSDFAVKVWQAAGTEPTAWAVQTSDSSVTAAGDLAVRSVLSTSNTNTLPVVFEYDNLALSGAVLERSTDQIRWSTVRGGASLGVTGTAFTVDDYEFVSDVVNYYRLRMPGLTPDTANITPSLGGIWIKNIARPFLNRQVTVIDWGDVRRASRNGVFDVVGRTMPVAVTDVRSSRRYELTLTTATAGEADELDLCLSSGDPVLLHTPINCPVPGMYAVVGDVTTSKLGPRSVRRYLNLPLIEVAQPDLSIVGATNTYQTVLNTYATYTALLAANATYQDVADGVADPGDVIVP